MMMPMTKPPMEAPTTLPLPPKTAAVKAHEPAPKPAVERDRLEIEAVDDATGGGQGRSDEKRGGDRPVDVDPHQAGRVSILCRCPHRAPDARASDELVEGDHQGDRDHHDQDVGDTDGRKSQVDAAGWQEVRV